MSDIHNIRLSGIIEESIVDGPGLRYVIFTQGCKHNCKNCHNPQTHDLNGGYIKNMDDLVEDILALSYIDGITISGGEPFLQAASINLIIKELRKKKDNCNILVYTGFTIEELKKMKDPTIDEILTNIDVLIDGKFIDGEKTMEIPFIGSKNQKVIPLSDAGRDSMKSYHLVEKTP